MSFIFSNFRYSNRLQSRLVCIIRVNFHQRSAISIIKTFTLCIFLIYIHIHKYIYKASNSFIQLIKNIIIFETLNIQKTFTFTLQSQIHIFKIIYQHQLNK